MTARRLTGPEIAAMRRRLPSAFRRPLGEQVLARGSWAVAVFAVGYLLWRFDMTPWRLAEGFSQIGGILALMVPPSPREFLPEILKGLAETVAMAFLGTLLAALVALPLGFLGANNVNTNPVAHFLVRRVFDVFRAVPALIWALIFVRAVGLGPLAGVLAIFASDVAALAKLYAEAIENTDRRAREGVRAAGGGNVLAIRFGLVPAVLPVMLSQALYFFESNVRSAAILGIVGAGGIGQQLSERVRLFAWDQVAFIIILFLVTVALIDFGSRWLRRRLMGAGLRAETVGQPG